MDTSFLTFLGISALVIASPGPDTALTVRNALLGGRRAGIFTALGVSVGDQGRRGRALSAQPTRGQPFHRALECSDVSP